jgi:hypothetical protein
MGDPSWKSDKIFPVSLNKIPPRHKKIRVQNVFCLFVISTQTRIEITYFSLICAIFLSYRTLSVLDHISISRECYKFLIKPKVSNACTQPQRTKENKPGCGAPRAPSPWQPARAVVARHDLAGIYESGKHFIYIFLTYINY